RLGGGAFLAGTSVGINTTIAGNHATGAGGGLYVSADTLDLFNTTVSGNQANSDAIGSGNGGGVSVAFGTFNFINTIMDGNTQIVVMGPHELLLYADNC